jgi:putative FmdB family regulatory protein
MPTYVYRCNKCEREFEQVQKMTDEPLTDCPSCDGEVSRVPFPVGIVFKGSGFHVNDYSSSGRSTTTAPTCGSSEKCAECPAAAANKN